MCAEFSSSSSKAVHERLLHSDIGGDLWQCTTLFSVRKPAICCGQDSLANVDYCSRVTACTEEQRAMVRHSIVFSVSVLDPVLNLNRNPLILSAKYRFFGDKGF